MLVLGHGKKYKIKPSGKNNEMGIDCSPININEWYYSEHISVDIDATVEPDIVHDLRIVPWPFEDGEFDTIIDCTGASLKNKYSRLFIEINRILADDGVFHGWKNNKPTTFKKYKNTMKST